MAWRTEKKEARVLETAGSSQGARGGGRCANSLPAAPDDSGASGSSWGRISGWIWQGAGEEKSGFLSYFGMKGSRNKLLISLGSKGSVFLKIKFPT